MSESRMKVSEVNISHFAAFNFSIFVGFWLPDKVKTLLVFRP